VLVPLDDGWVYLTEGDSKFQIRTKTFDSIEEAKNFVEPWGVYDIVELVDE
jgi:hypothetical protein